MGKTIAIHSFRGGTGKSNTTANLAALLAVMGKRVGVVDTDIQSPGIHVLFGLDRDQTHRLLNDYLWGKCEIRDAAHDVTDRLCGACAGRLFLIPSSARGDEIARVLREGYSVEMLNDGFQCLMKDLNLDVLLIDTHPGLNQETLLSIAISDILVILMRPDQQDYLGTEVTVEVARRLEVPRMLLVVNKTPAVFGAAEVKAQAEASYGCEVVAVLPHSEEMMCLASGGIFSLLHPSHPVTSIYREIAASLLI
ncbi:MAG: MinD/ParA family ATP-binding protein [Methylococcales bacterium]